MAIFTLVVFGLIGIANCGPSHVTCPVPLSPEHGQSFMYQEGHVVKYVCEPGYALKGKEIVRCVDGEWEGPNPTCIEFGNEDVEVSEDIVTDPLLPVSPERPLFKWDSEAGETEQENNSTSEETPLSDEARVRLLMYPRRRARIVTTHVQTGRLQSATELEGEEKKRSQDGKKSMYLESPPSVVYVRRTIIPGKSDTSRKALEMNVENGRDIEVVSLPRAAVSQNDKGQQYNDYWRQLYWYNHYNYPRHASLVQYSGGAPVVMTLTESQLAWINSLHPELRDQYLKDTYIVRAEDNAEGERAQALLRRYEDAYNYYYHVPYLRQPVSLVMEDPIANYDYTCHQSGQPFIKAPRLRNMHIARYDRRQNPNQPRNNYLTAIYRCNPGYVMMDTRFTELHCSNKSWVGVKPVCVRRG